ncbi:hypothetical protein D3C85_858510 [compost metagenome]
MNIKMSTGREVVNLFAEPAKVEATAAADNMATAAVNNTEEGVCPKCSRTMGIAIIPLGQVYYCTPCRVSTPMMES